MKVKIGMIDSKFYFLLFAFALVVGGCKSPMGGGEDPAKAECDMSANAGQKKTAVNDPVVGKWQAVDIENRTSADDPRTAVPKSRWETKLECREDGCLVLQSGKDMSKYHWRRCEDGVILVETMSGGKAFSMMKIEVKGNMLTLSNQGGVTRFMRVN